MSPACCQRLQDVSYSGMGLPQRSRLCIERYVPSQRVRAVDMERSDRRHQPITAAQSGLTVYVTSLLPEAPGRNIEL